MKALYIVIAMLTLFVSACAQNAITGDVTSQGQVTTQDTPQVVSNESGPINSANDGVQTSKQTVPITQLYNYDSVKQFTYRMTTDDQNSSLVFDYRIESDTVNSRPAWLSTSQMQAEGSKVITQVWSDKANFKCLRIKSFVTVDGREIETPTKCPDQGPESDQDEEVARLEFVGTETVSVPAGTYQTKKYSFNNSITYFYATEVPIPVKILYDDQNSSLELVKWND